MTFRSCCCTPLSACAGEDIPQQWRAMSLVRKLLWMAIAALAALGIGIIALRRGEAINALWLVTAALCSYAIGFRFYSKFIAAKVLLLDDTRATPAERLENGRDFVRTN